MKLVTYLVLILLVTTTTLFFQVDSVVGQNNDDDEKEPIPLSDVPQEVQEVKDEVESNAVQIDATSATTLAGLGVGGFALAKEMLSSKKLKESDKRTDRDTGKSQLYFYRLIQTMDAMIPEVSKCLDQPFNSDPMQKHITIRMKLAEDANSTAEYLMTQLNTVVPSMTPSAAVIVTDGIKSVESTANNNTPPPSQQQQTASSTVTNTT